MPHNSMCFPGNAIWFGTLFLLLPIAGWSSEECPFLAMNTEGVLVAWTTGTRGTTQFGIDMEATTTAVDLFRPVALIKNGMITTTTGESIKKGQNFWRVPDAGDYPVQLTSVDSFLDRIGVDHCVYYGSLSDTEVPKWTLFTSKPMPGVLKQPSQKDKERFEKEKSDCQDQGDFPPDKKPPCAKPKLLAVSDINKNGKQEYWATQPYMWDTGLSVWEDAGELVPVIQVCVGCSD